MAVLKPETPYSLHPFYVAPSSMWEAMTKTSMR